VSVLEKEEVNLFSFRCVSSGPRRSSLLFRITDETLSMLTAVTRTVLTHAGIWTVCVCRGPCIAHWTWVKIIFKLELFREVYGINLEVNTCLIRARDVLKWRIQYHWNFKPGLGSSCLRILTILDCWFCQRRTAAKKKISEPFQCLKWTWQNSSLQVCKVVLNMSQVGALITRNPRLYLCMKWISNL